MTSGIQNGRWGAGMTSLAIAFPSILRTNAYWREHHAGLVAAAEEHTLAKLWAASDAKPTLFDRVMRPHLEDPFRGARERRIRAPSETALSMELRAARKALRARGLTPANIDLTLVTSFVADRFGVGNAALLAAELELPGPCWNYETACSGSVVGLHMAANLIESGRYERILVVASTSNSVQVDDGDTLGWFVGDGAGAFVVEPVDRGLGVLGQATLNSVATNDMFVIHSVPDDSREDGTRLSTTANPRAATMARESAEPYLRQCVGDALLSAGASPGDVDFWVFNTPNAWYADFCAQVLGIPEERYHSIYPRYANIGAALMPATLYHAIEKGRVSPGDLVVFYSIGSTSTASAVVARLGSVALGESPPRPEPNADVR